MRPFVLRSPSQFRPAAPPKLTSKRWVADYNEVHLLGNPATPGDPSWQPLLVTPNHPEYPSAHGCATTALFTVVARLVGTHRIDVDMDSVLPGTTHHFATLEQLVREVGNARVWAGLHWRFSTEAGGRLGGLVALEVLSTR